MPTVKFVRPGVDNVDRGIPDSNNFGADFFYMGPAPDSKMEILDYEWSWIIKKNSPGYQLCLVTGLLFKLHKL